ncbi:MAG: PQQ-binding-like beta-propeller repeat protein [Planctomycetales bacterium]
MSKETGLLQEWPQGGPQLRWQAKEIGTGYSTPSIAKGRVYLQTTRGNEEFALAVDEQQGTNIWSVPIGKVGVNRGPQYPGTRATPTVDGDRVYCLASDGELLCLAAADGKVVWKKNLRSDFEGKDGNWAYTESVLIDGDRLICTPGGEKATLAALNKGTGETIWQGAVPDGDNAEYASIMAVGEGKSRAYVQFLRKGLVAVEAQTGKFLWRYEKTIDPGANILTPVVDANRVFCAGSRTGGALLELPDAGGIPKEVYFSKSVSPGIGGAVLIDGFLYGTNSQTLFCAEFATGKVRWTERSVGAASVCFADHRLYARIHGSGDVALVDPSPDAFREAGRLKQPDRSQTQAWPHPVVSNGGLYLRDQGTLLCFQVKP